ncbi:MAG: transposase family protein, partial [Edaphobacter sp.]|nr:transposase family protein [Edaphobacter sp.]
MLVAASLHPRRVERLRAESIAPYQRKLADLPWEGLPVVILLQARKFFCVGDSCRRKIFTEPLPG